MISYFNQLLAEDLSIEDTVRKGAMLRVRPVLMSATVVSLGLIPLCWRLAWDRRSSPASPCDRGGRGLDNLNTADPRAASRPLQLVPGT